MRAINSSTKKIIIKPKTNPFNIDWREIWESRDLLYFLTWRDLKVRYKQTVLGILWIVLQPLLSMLLFTIVFGNFAKIPSNNIPYPIFVFIGLVYWNFFSQTIASSSASLVNNENIIKKVYFPRLINPLASTLSHFIDLIPISAILGLLMIYYKITPNLQSIIFFPILLFLVFATSLGLGMLLAPINAKFRDIRYVLPYFIQLGMFVTPVIYPTSLLEEISTLIRIFNPVAEAIEVSRSLLFETKPVDWNILALSFLFAFLLLFAGFYYFRSQEDNFVDIL